MQLDTLNIEIFLAIVETGSFTKAAEQIHRTQSAVSQQISKLEDMLGKPLFARGKQLLLTPDGEIFYGYAKRIFKLHREVLDRFKEPELTGEVTFGLPEDFASVFLSDILVKFTQIHPRIQLNVECDLTLNLLNRFKKKEFDLVLLKMSKPQDLPNGLDVWSEKLVWVGNPSLVQTHRTIRLIVSPQPCVYRKRVIEALRQADLKWRIVFSSHSYAGTIAAVKAGLGITVLPKNMVPKDLPIIEKSPTLPLLHDTHISLLKHEEHDPIVNSFENFVIQKLQR